MGIYLGSEPSRVTLRQALLVHLVLALVLWGVATAQGQPVRASLQGLYVDVGAKRIVVLPSVTSDWRVCDGGDGACVPVGALREATAVIARGRR